MKVNEKELQTCLEFCLQPFLKKYDLMILEAKLTITDQIKIQATLKYQDHTLDLYASFLMDYQDHQIYFYDIEGKVEYLFLTLNVMNVLKQIVRDPHMIINEDYCSYACELPIVSMKIQDHMLELILK